MPTTTTTIGIDLGAANSGAFFREGEEAPRAIVNKEGPTIQGKLLPSYVEFNQDGTPLYVGRQAYDDYRTGIENPFVWGAKRLIGLSFEKARTEIRHLDYNIDRNEDDGTVLIPVARQTYTPVDIAAMILNKIRKDALDENLNPVNRIDRVVVSHPAYFDGSRREATLRAVRQVFDGLSEEAIDMVPEPTAAAYGYGLQLPPNTPQSVCVIDMGAGTLDIVRAMLGRDDEGNITMIGDPALGNESFGGIDIDDILLDWAIQEYKLTDLQEIRARGTMADMDTARANYELRGLRAGLETMKIRLSDLKRAPQQQIEVMYHGESLLITLTRDNIQTLLDKPLPPEKVEELVGHSLVSDKMVKIKEALRTFYPEEERETPSFLDLLRLTILTAVTEGNQSIQDINHVLLVGGPMKMPCIRQAIREVFVSNDAVSHELQQIEEEGFSIDPMECVARGAALYRGGIGGLEYHYAIVRTELPQPDGKTCIYCYPDASLSRGEMTPLKKTTPAKSIRHEVGVPVEPITVLEGGEEAVVPGVKEILWRRCRVYQFRPLFDSKGDAPYTITLGADKRKIVTCTVKDGNSGQEYSFIVLSEEELPADRFEVTFRDPEIEITYGYVQAERFHGMLTSAKAGQWLDDRHDTEEEQNRPGVEQHLGILNSLLPRLSFADGHNPEEIVTDSQELALFGGTVQEDREVTKRITPGYLTGREIEEARNRAQGFIQEIEALPGDESEQLQMLIQRKEHLKGLLPRLPVLQVDETTSREAHIAIYVDVCDRTEELRMALDAYSK